MSWSHQNTGTSGEEIVKQLRDKTETTQMPDLIVDAIEKSLAAFGNGVEGTEREIHVTSYGHIGPDGQGNASIVINVTKKPVDAKTEEGSRELADRLKSGS